MHMSSRSTFFATVRPAHAARRAPLALALAVILGVAPLAASAATLSVDNGSDAGVAMTCTLRQAMVTLNNGTTAGADEGSCRANATGAFGVDDTILFDPAVFPAGASNTITLAGSALHASIATDVTIDATVNSHVTH